MDDVERKVKLVDSLPLSHRDLLMDVAGDLVDLTDEQLEFVSLVVASCIADGGRPLDPMPLCAAACARWRKRKTKEN